MTYIKENSSINLGISYHNIKNTLHAIFKVTASIQNDIYNLNYYELIKIKINYYIYKHVIKKYFSEQKLALCSSLFKQYKLFRQFKQFKHFNFDYN